MIEITHQQQPSGDTCSSACIAMILNKPVVEVIEEFHDAYFENKISVAAYLARNDVNFREMYISEDPDWKLYLAAVPSLNIIGGLHHILLDLRYGDCVVFDPNKGRANIKYYISYHDVPKNDLEVSLTSYITDMEIEE